MALYRVSLKHHMHSATKASAAEHAAYIMRDLETPETVIQKANKEALITPSSDGYFGGRAEQRYVYQPGKVYLVVSSPNHPPTLLLPPNERLAAAPVIHQCAEQDQDNACWIVGATEIGSEQRHQEAVILRPAKAGLDSTMPLLTQGGRAYSIRLRSQEGMGMIAVTWELPSVQVLPTSNDRQPMPEPQGSQPPTSTLRAPVIALDRLHTAYTIEVASKQRPPWVPLQVFDDGTRSFIRFKEDLGFTAAPAVFGVHADRSPATVEFTPYTPPQGGLTYIVQGLYPELRLRGTDGQEVQIVRGPHGR